MTVPVALVAVISDAIASKPSFPRYTWPVKDRVWGLLQTGFDHTAFGDDTVAQNIALKAHLSQYWPGQPHQEKVRLASWIVRDWGGIRANRDMTIIGYVEKADAELPTTPFLGVASYSKVLAMKHPDRYAIYDARAAASILAIQLLNLDQLPDDSRILFPIPSGRNTTIAGNNEQEGFVEIFTRNVLARRGFSPVPRSGAYSLYLELLAAVAHAANQTILKTEMFLFSSAPALCRAAMQNQNIA